MKPHTPNLITTLEEIESLAEKLAQSDVIGVDTEFIRETSFYPKIALIQVATQDQVWLIDPTVLSKEQLSPFLQILAKKEVLKIFHASHADQECLFWNYGVIAAPVLDTSVAAGLCGMGDSIGLQKLLRESLGIHVPKGRARAKWLNRPLSTELLNYAEQDVAHLVDLSLYLKEKLAKRDRWEWAIEESEVDPKVFDISPEELAAKIAKGAHLEKEQAVLAELVSWRESRAREANLPRGWIADNEVLIALARTQPKSIEELKTFRGIHSKEVDKSGKRILEAIAKGKLKIGSTPIEPKIDLPRIDGHAANLIQTYISFLAGYHQIMPRYLMNTHQSTQILYHVDKNPQEWVEQGILTEHAAKLIGTDLKALFDGHKALRIKNKRLAIVDLNS